ncbi:hypothetical protein BDV97DRAFT_366856 [Delphinella strobiligena]|nr:hypothetical protein BDV97DRAFT_366856 [Delphinella strobiligena]
MSGYGQSCIITNNAQPNKRHDNSTAPRACKKPTTVRLAAGLYEAGDAYGEELVRDIGSDMSDADLIAKHGLVGSEFSNLDAKEVYSRMRLFLREQREWDGLAYIARTFTCRHLILSSETSLPLSYGHTTFSTQFASICAQQSNTEMMAPPTKDATAMRPANIYLDLPLELHRIINSYILRPSDCKALYLIYKET